MLHPAACHGDYELRAWPRLNGPAGGAKLQRRPIAKAPESTEEGPSWTPKDAHNNHAEVFVVYERNQCTFQQSCAGTPNYVLRAQWERQNYGRRQKTKEKKTKSKGSKLHICQYVYVYVPVLNVTCGSKTTRKGNPESLPKCQSRQGAVPSLVWQVLLHPAACHTDNGLRVWPRLNGTTALDKSF